MQPNGGAPSDIATNAPSAALAYTAFSAIFGNYNFMVTPSMPGKIDTGFPSVPYLSLEALLYSQAASNPAVAPTSILSGTNVGQQQTTGQITQSDSTGTTRSFSGYSSTK